MKKKKFDNGLVLRPIPRTINYIIMFLVFITMVIPLWNVIVVSTSSTLTSTEPGMNLWWSDFSLEGYKYVLNVVHIARPFFNSLFVTTIATFLDVILASLTGYVLIQKELPFKGIITSFVMLTMMIPSDLTMVSIYQVNIQLHLIDTYAGLILNGVVSAFAILLMRNYFLSVPYSLAESSRIDGATELRIFGKVYLPLSLPGMATVFFLEFVSKWNSITIPATITTKESMFTLPLMLKSLISDQTSTSGAPAAPPNAIMASIVISTVPLLIIYVFAQRFLMSGITMGATKE